MLTVTEKQPTPGYTLEVDQRASTSRATGDFAGEPGASSPPDGDTTVSGSTINLKVNLYEWVKCYVTNVPDTAGDPRRQGRPGHGALR